MTPYEPEKNRAALLPEAELNEAASGEIRDYIAKSGMTLTMFARRINYSYSALRNYLDGKYHQVAGSGRKIRRAAESFMQANPIAPPTLLKGELYDTENIRLIRRTFEEMTGAERVGGMVYAPPGSQKSFGLEYSVADFNRQELPKNGHGRRAFYVYCREDIRPRDMMQRVAVACGCATGRNTDDILRNLAWEFRSRRVLLVIDEAQHLSLKCLETIRELYDQPPYFSLLFSGSHNLKQTLDRYAATLGQLNSRIVIKLSLPGLVRNEADGIVRRELREVIAKMGDSEVKVLVDELIRQSTEKDIYESGRTYINVRTLTSVLTRMKLKLAQTSEAAHA